MNSRGAMEILLALLALEAGIISEQLFVALVIMAVVTSLISGPALVRLLRPSPSPIVALLRAGEIVLDPTARTPRGAHRRARHRARRAPRPPRATPRASPPRALEREELAGTGVGDGVAFPHAEIEGLERPRSPSRGSATALDFDAPDGEAARLVFLLLMPPREYAGSSRSSRRWRGSCMHEPVRRGLLVAEGDAGVLATLTAADRNRAGTPIAR